MTRHLHLDVVGGISGDMFLATMLSAFPEFETQLRQDLTDAGLNPHVGLARETVRKSGFAATQVRFDMSQEAPATKHWADIQNFIKNSGLRDEVKSTALTIFSHLAEAEAACHGIEVEKVHFHEVADWDSLADIISAASVIAQSKSESWSCSALPLGSGQVRSQHGIIPVPAPATAYLLTGFPSTDDGVSGERITPTGAAILKFLSPSSHKMAGTLERIGTGAGQKNFDGVPNILRLLQIETQQTQTQFEVDWVCEINFEIDDMTPEEIAISLEHIRAHDAVIDAVITQGLGKKSRPNFTFRILGVPQSTEELATLCFSETSTIGLRMKTVERRTLPRLTAQGGGTIKTVLRPDGVSRKIESDILEPVQGLEARRAIARNAIDGGGNE